MPSERTREGQSPLLSAAAGDIEAQIQERRPEQATNTAGVYGFLRKSYDFLCNMSPEHKVRFVQVILGITVITCLAFIFKELSKEAKNNNGDGHNDDRLRLR